MIDQIIVGIYFLIILFIGTIISRKAKDLKEYTRVEVKLGNNIFILIATIFATSVGGGGTFGVAEKAFSGDLSYTYALLLITITDILLVKYVISHFSKFHGAISIGDIFQRFYGTSGKLISGIASTIITIAYLAAQINVSGYVLNYFFKISHLHAVIVSYTIVLVYTFSGGLRSIIYTNIFQFIIMLTAIPAIMMIGINKLGGFNNFISLIPENKYMLNIGNLQNIFAALLGFSVMGLHPTFIQKVLISDQNQKVRKAIYYKISIYIFYTLTITIIGLTASLLFPQVKSTHAIVHMVNVLVPVGFKGLILIGLLASIMSTADADLNVASLSITNDIIKPLFRITEDNKILLIARITTIFISMFAIWLATSFNNPIDLVIYMGGLYSPVVFVPLIGLLYNKVISSKGFFTTTLGGIISFVIWSEYFEDIYKIKAVFIGTLVNFIIFVVFLKAEENNIGRK